MIKSTFARNQDGYEIAFTWTGGLNLNDILRNLDVEE